MLIILNALLVRHPVTGLIMTNKVFNAKLILHVPIECHNYKASIRTKKTYSIIMKACFAILYLSVVT